MENMNNGAEIIHQDPGRRTGAFQVTWRSECFFFYSFIDAVGNRFDMGIGVAFADDKEISRSVTKFSQVELNNIFAFLVTDTLNDGMI